VASFSLAVAKVKSFLDSSGFPVEVDMMNLKRMREQKISIQGIIDWLLGSHIHFLITHPHQGLESAGDSIVDIYAEVARLKYHPGFPSEIQVNCPIFCKDMWEYLQHLPAIMPTCKIFLSEEVEVEATQQEVESVVSRRLVYL
jgi:hypothetical protein